jgi:hypothetical protein
MRTIIQRYRFNDKISYANSLSLQLENFIEVHIYNKRFKVFYHPSFVVLF